MRRFLASLLVTTSLLFGTWVLLDDPTGVVESHEPSWGPFRSGVELGDREPGKTDDAASPGGSSGSDAGGPTGASSSTRRPSEKDSPAGREGGRVPGAPSSAPGQPLSADGTEPGKACDVAEPTGADGWNRLFAQFDSTPTLEGADHGGSVALADGRRMFVFGDTIRAPDHPPYMVSNSVMTTNGGCLTPMPVAHDGPAIPDQGKTIHWPMSLRASAAPGGSVVEVFTTQVERRGRTFVSVGNSLATFEVPTNRTPRLMSNVPIGPRTEDPRHPTWGAAVWESGGQVYIFGTTSNATKSTHGWSLRVARAAPDALSDPASWEYWSGSSWVPGDPSVSRAPQASLIAADNGVSHVLSVIERHGAWYAISKEGDFTGDRLTVWKAPSPTGPWTAHQVRDLANTGGIVRYTPLAHPDVATASGRLLISWSESPRPFRRTRDDASTYRPRFAEIDLP